MPAGTLPYSQYTDGSSTTTQQSRTSSGIGGVPSPSQPLTPIATGGPRNAGASQVANYSFRVILDANNTPQLVPPFRVPEGCAVRVRANNGTVAGNTAVVYVADTRDKFKGGKGVPLSPLDDVAWPVLNLARIWVSGTAGDGVVVSIFSVAGNGS